MPSDEYVTTRSYFYAPEIMRECAFMQGISVDETLDSAYERRRCDGANGEVDGVEHDDM